MLLGWTRFHWVFLGSFEPNNDLVPSWTELFCSFLLFQERFLHTRFSFRKKKVRFFFVSRSPRVISERFHTWLECRTGFSVSLSFFLPFFLSLSFHSLSHLAGSAWECAGVATPTSGPPWNPIQFRSNGTHQQQQHCVVVVVVVVVVAKILQTERESAKQKPIDKNVRKRGRKRKENDVNKNKKQKKRKQFFQSRDAQRRRRLLRPINVERDWGDVVDPCDLLAVPLPDSFCVCVCFFRRFFFLLASFLFLAFLVPFLAPELGRFYFFSATFFFLSRIFTWPALFSPSFFLGFTSFLLVFFYWGFLVFTGFRCVSLDFFFSFFDAIHPLSRVFTKFSSFFLCISLNYCQIVLVCT